MININLLPEEYIKASRSAPKTMVLLLVASLLAFGGLGTLGTLFFKVRADAEADVAIVSDQLEHMRPQAEFADALEKERKEFERRTSTILEIAKSRIVWTSKLNQLSDIINRDLTDDRYQVWLRSLSLNGRVDKAKPGINLTGFASGDRIEAGSDFDRDLKADPIFSEHFESFNLSDLAVDSSDEDLLPPQKVRFRFEALLPVVKKKRGRR